MTEEATKQEAMQRLKELVLDHLGMPRPKQNVHIQTLPDQLLPEFTRLARQAWHAASPMVLDNDPSVNYIADATQANVTNVSTLNSILEELGVHDLLRDVAVSPDATLVSEIPLDPFEERLLREAGHRKAGAAVGEFLRYAGKNPAASDEELKTAEQTFLDTHNQINIIIQTTPRGPTIFAGDVASIAKPKRFRLFSGLAKLRSDQPVERTLVS